MKRLGFHDWTIEATWSEWSLPMAPSPAAATTKGCPAGGDVNTGLKVLVLTGGEITPLAKASLTVAMVEPKPSLIVALKPRVCRPSTYFALGRVICEGAAHGSLPIVK